MPKPKTDTAEGFVGSVFKFSISTFASIGILGLSIVLTGLFIPTGLQGEISPFINWTNTIMTIAILGLDQALIRFYYKPPNGLTANGLFRICFYASSAVLLVAGTVCSTLLATPIYNAIGFQSAGLYVVPMLFLNAFFFLILRYFNVLYRMEMNIKIYTLESILMQFFYKLFYVLGFFIGGGNPLLAMMICSLAGLGSFALIFSFVRRKALRPSGAEFRSGGYKTVLPYGIMVAPTAVFVTLNSAVPSSYILNTLGKDMNGIYSFSYTLSNVVTLIQGGFASFWGAFMFENYETQKERIMRVHDYLNFVILVFFCALVAFEDVAFLIFRQYAAAQSIFPLMMLSAVFTILCETTVYGNAIARKPYFDTIGFALSFVTNITFCMLLVGQFALYGAAIAVVCANLIMFVFRTITAQRLYKSIQNPGKTVLAVALAIVLAVAGTVFAYNFVAKLLCSLVAAGLYCLLYRAQLGRLWGLGLSILKSLFPAKKA